MDPTSFLNIGWPAAATILGAIIAFLTFLMAALNTYWNVGGRGGRHSTSKDEESLQRKLGEVEKERREMREHRHLITKHTQEILVVQQEIQRLQMELDHLKESLGTKDDQIIKQIEEMKGTIDKLTDMLIKLLTES